MRGNFSPISIVLRATTRLFEYWMRLCFSYGMSDQGRSFVEASAGPVSFLVTSSSLRRIFVVYLLLIKTCKLFCESIFSCCCHRSFPAMFR